MPTWRTSDYVESPSIVDVNQDTTFADSDANYGYVGQKGLRGIELADKQRYALSDGRAEAAAETLVLGYGVGGAVQVGQLIEISGDTSTVNGLEITFEGEGGSSEPDDYVAGGRSIFKSSASVECMLLVLKGKEPQFPSEQHSSVIAEEELVDRDITSWPVQRWEGEFANHNPTLYIPNEQMSDGDLFRLCVGAQALVTADIAGEAAADIHSGSNGILLNGYVEYSSISLNWV